MNKYSNVLRDLALEKKALLENYDNDSKIKLWRDINDSQHNIQVFKWVVDFYEF